MKTIAAILALSLGTVPASAAMYSFSYSPSQALFGVPTSAEGVFTTSDTAIMVGGRTAFAITSITGTANGSVIAAPQGFYGNYFTEGPAFLDGSGIRFFTTSGSDIRFFFQDSVSRYRVNIFGTNGGKSFFANAESSPVAAPVPEPAAWAMMIIGFGLVGGALRRRGATAAA